MMKPQKFKIVLFLILFMGRNVFAGPSAPIAFEAHFEQTVLVISADKNIVKALLTPEQELAAQSLTDATHNPLMLIHVHYPDMTGPKSFESTSYDEFLVSIPNAQLKSGYECGGQEPGTAAFMPKLFLNRQLPIDVGVKYYGFNKVMAQISSSASDFEVRTSDGAPIYSALFGSESTLSPLGLYNFSKIMKLVPYALMGRLVHADGSASMMWSGLEVKPESVTSLSVSAQDDALIVKGLDSLVSHQFASAGVNAKILGSYRMRGLLKGTEPVECFKK
jgi:hypothetical protein